jgi:hypothetical protein
MAASSSFPANTCVPTFEVVKAHGGRTAWTDKHPSYEWTNGPAAKVWTISTAPKSIPFPYRFPSRAALRFPFLIPLPTIAGPPASPTATTTTKTNLLAITGLAQQNERLSSSRSFLSALVRTLLAFYVHQSSAFLVIPTEVARPFLPFAHRTPGHLVEGPGQRFSNSFKRGNHRGSNPATPRCAQLCLFLSESC